MNFSNIDRDGLMLSALGALTTIYLIFSGNQVFLVIGVSIVVRLLIGYAENRLNSIRVKFILIAFATILLVLIGSAADDALSHHYILLNLFGGMSLPSVIVSMFKKSRETRQ